MHHRFCVSGPIAADSVVALEGEELHHAARVARVRTGEQVELFDGHGRAVAGRIEVLETNRVLIRVEQEIESREARVAVTLAMAIINLDRFELVLQKATELGVATIVPLVSDRVEIRAERYAGKEERWRRIVLEAVKQCGRAAIPAITAPVRFDEIAGRGAAAILFDADAVPTSEPLTGEPMTLLVGPEGGWSDRELALARDRGCRFRRLGPRRLRAETAAIAGMAIVMSELGLLLS
ncbi:MAG TPA: RsmE family RNA methyltransferase [Thermoanaerobaculia bacterium]|nr:RsmE family RNA methyltransferase [Thermoanaerobaculia bacterium]